MPGVERDAELVAVEDQGIDRLAVDGRALEPGVLTAGPLDLDDLGAEVAQDLGAQRAGDEPAEVEDADAGERQVRGFRARGLRVPFHRMSPPVASQRRRSNSAGGTPPPRDRAIRWYGSWLNGTVADGPSLRTAARSRDDGEVTAWTTTGRRTAVAAAHLRSSASRSSSAA